MPRMLIQRWDRHNCGADIVSEEPFLTFWTEMDLRDKKGDKGRQTSKTCPAVLNLLQVEINRTSRDLVG